MAEYYSYDLGQEEEALERMKAEGPKTVLLPEKTKIPWLLLAAVGAGVYFLFLREEREKK